MSIFWRWLRYLLAVVAAFVVGGVAWIGWLLSGQRYQALLTEQLSSLFGAQVHVERSHFSWHSGLGLQLDAISIQDEGSETPFFVAESVELRLDLTAFWRGQLLFHRIDFVRPRLHITIAGERLFQLIRRIRETSDARVGSGSWLTLHWTPTLAVQDLRLRDAEITYTKTEKSATLLLVETEASLTFSEEAIPTVTLRTTLRDKNDDIGQVFLNATTTQEVDFTMLQQGEWSGEIELSNMRLQRLGRVFAERWPSLRFGVKGRFQGTKEGPLNFSGVLNADELQVGAIRLNDIELHTTKARWGGFLADSWLRALSLEATLMRLQGEVGEDAVKLVVSKGDLTFQGDNLNLTRLSGSYGNTSQLIDASVSLQNLLTKDGPKLDARMTADIDLGDDLLRLITALSPSGAGDFSQVLSQSEGRALAQLRVRRAKTRSVPVYNGSVTLQKVRTQVLPWHLGVEELNGRVDIDGNILSSEALAFKVGQSSFKAQGQVRDFLSSQRSADLRLTFNAMRDYDLTPFLPPGKMIPQGGLLEGDVNVTFPSFDETPQLTGRLGLAQVRFDLLDFLQPFEITTGELYLNERGGTFAVQRGQLPGGVFSGHGRIASWTPLRLELSGDFPELDLEAALALDKPEDGQSEDATRDIQATLSSKRLMYKGTQLDNLTFFCHWHDRQADLRIGHAGVAGGTLRSDIVLWPDIDAAFLRPRLDKVDVVQFFRAIGVSSDVLSGTLTGEGTIYMPQWQHWDELALWNASLSLTVENGVAQRLPILVRLWSVLSMQGLLRLQLPGLPTGGFPFTLLTGDFVFSEGIASTNNLSLGGDSVRIDANGWIDLKQRSLDLKTALVPLHGITRNVAKVPLAGKLLAQSADYLTTLNFRVSGPYHDPSVTPLLP